MRNILLTIIMLLATLSVKADNVVAVSSASGHPGDEVTLQLSLSNTDAVVAFQTEIPLGDNLSYVANSVALNADRITDHSVTAAVVGGKLRIFAYSLSLTPFVGNEGTLLSFTLKLKNEPGDNTINVTASKLSNVSGEAVSFTANNGVVTILSPKLQINTGTINYGHVPIWSEYNGTAQVTNVGNEPLTITAINFSNMVFSCPSFAETTIPAGQSASFTIKFDPMVKGAVNVTATIVSNSISGNGAISLMADPFAVNEVHIENTSGYCDSIVNVPLRVNNMEQLIGFQLDMKMPTALEYVGFELSSRKTDHVCTGVVYNDTLRVMAYSPTGSAFTGDDGIVAYIKVRLHGLYGYYYLNPFKSVLADAVGENVLSEKYQGYVNIKSPRIGGNSSLDMGNSSVTETVTKEYVVSNNGNAQMRIDNVVFDQQDWTVAETFPFTVEQYSNTVLHVSYNREHKGDFNATMKIYSNDPQSGLKNVALSGHRYEPNSLSIEADPFILDNGDIAVAISMDNYTDIVALQADFVYPYQDYSVAQADFELAERIENHTLYAVATNDSTYRVMVFSMQNIEVEGNDGVVLNVTMHPIGSPEDKEYAVSLSNIVLSGSDGVNIFSGDDTSGTYTLSVTQARSLVNGWSWYSTYIEQSGINGLTMFESSMGTAGVRIQARNGYAEQYEYQGTYTWYGTLNSITNEQMYKVRTNAACNAAMTGLPANPSNHPITINSGWNWIGFPNNQSVSVTEAMSGYTPADNDVIKGRNASTTYLAGYNMWYGTLNTFEPGQGYMYKSNSTTAKTLTFNTNAKADVVANLTTENNVFVPNDAEYADNMLVTAVINIKEEELRSEEYELAAFVNDECRGSVKLMYVEPFDRYVAFLLVFGEEAESISFVLTDGDETMMSSDRMVYASDAIIGTLSEPATISFGADGVNDNDAMSVQVYPNPTKDVLNVNCEGLRKVEVINAFGQVVTVKEANGDNIRIDLGDNAAGAYMVRIFTENGLINRQIVKN